MKRAEIIKRRREFVVHGYKTLADVGFDGNWVTPIQKTSKSKTGPVLIAKHWLDAPSVYENRDVLEEKGYIPSILFNRVLDRALEQVSLTRKNIYITQAFHLLPLHTRSEYIPRRYLYETFGRITRHEVQGRVVIALGEDAQAACRRFKVKFIPCIHPSRQGYTLEYKLEMLAKALKEALAEIS